MKILIIGKTLSTGGTSRYTINLVRDFRNRKELDFDFVNLKRFYDLPGEYMKRIDLMLRFPKEIDYDRYDLIHFLEFDYSLYGAIKYAMKRKKRAKIIQTSHGMAKKEEIYNGFFKRYVFKPWACYAQKHVQQNVDAIIYVSDDQRELHVREFKLNRAKTYVVYLAGSFETYTGSTRNLIKNKENTILFVGRFERRKRIEKVFEVATLMPDVKFKVIGHVDDFHYYHELRRLKPGNTELLTDVSDDELVTAYRKAKYFVSFSKWENCPVTYLECISQGTPVIAYSMPIKAMIKNRCGYRVQTPAECAAKIGELEKDYDSLVQNTLFTSSLFSWAKTAEETVKIYKDVLSV